MSIGYAAAFVGGLLALLSPCSALLLPSFFAYAFNSRTELVARTGVFGLGLAAVLVPMGVGSSYASIVFYGHRALLVAVAGWLIIGFGVMQLVGAGFAARPARRAQSALTGRRSTPAVFGLGAAYGLAGFCSGPILGAVLTVSAATGRPAQGAVLLFVYALGMTVPLLALALLWDRFDLGRRGWLRGRRVRLGRLQLHTTSLVSGTLFVGVGALFLAFDGTAALNGAFGVGVSVDREASLQQGALGAVSGIPDVVTVTVGAGVALAVALTVIVRRHRDDDAAADPVDGGPGSVDDASAAAESSSAT